MEENLVGYFFHSAELSVFQGKHIWACQAAIEIVPGEGIGERILGAHK